LLPPAISVSRERALEVMEAIDNPAIAEEVIRQLGLDRSMEPAELLENLTVEVIAGIQFVQLSYRDTNPLRAQMISNAVAKVASEEVRQEAFVYGLRIHVWERASAPTDPVSPNPVRSGFLALVLGLAAGIGLALLMEWRTS
jgi:capsular polysaccharide biosynthesis protein